ncbi:MAG TPA: PAS domain S-box protein [Gemmatimonadales bacterium]|nr:PAS domain S-box protein [Gemmatimonadales bacterium]
MLPSEVQHALLASVETGVEPTFVVDSAGMIHYANEPATAFAAAFGQAAVGRSFHTLVPDALWERGMAALQTAFASGQPVEIIERDPTRPEWYEVRMTPAGSLAVLRVRDVTARMKRDKRARLEEAITSAFFETDDLAGLLVRVAERMRRTAGWSAAECWIASADGEWVQCGGDGDDELAIQVFLGASRGIRFAVGEGVPALAAAAGIPTIFPVLDAASGFKRTELAREARFAGAFAIPLFEDGRPLAVITFFDTKPFDTTVWAEVAISLAGHLHAIVLRHRQASTLARFFAVSPTGMVVAGMDGRFRRVNPAFCQMLGRSAHELLAQPWLAFIHPDDVQPTIEAAAQVSRGGPALGFVNRYRHADGSWRALEWTALPMTAEGTSYATVRDVTEARRHAAMEALQRDAIQGVAEGRSLDEALDRICRSIEAALPDVRASILHVRDGLLFTAAAPNLPSTYSAGLNGAPIGPRAGSCGTAAWRGETVIVPDVRTDPLWEGLHHLATPHGLLGCWSVPVKGRRGDVVATAAAYTSTPRAPDPAELAALESAARLVAIAIDRNQLDNELARLDAAIENLNDIVMITEAEPINAPDGPKILFVNRAFERLMGYHRSEVIGKTPRMLQGPVTDRATLDRVRAALERWQPVRVEVANVTKDGRTVWLEMDISPIADAKGWYTHWVAVERDITERKLLEGQLREAQKMEAVGRLAGGVAHDFNNMLTAISGFAELLALELGPGKGAESVHEIRRAADRSADLVRKLLAFSRRQVMQVRTVDLRDLVREMVPLLTRLAGESIQMTVAVDDAPILASVDPAQLEQVLLNLVVNARDAMPDGGRMTISAHRTTTPEGERAVLAVQDTGTGIPAELQGQIFEPFFTTRADRGGTGLGLSTVFGIVTQSGGRIAVQSAEGQGTTMTVTLPLAQSGRELTPPPVPPPARGAATGTILVVEDEELVRRYVVRMLEREGYAVLAVGDAPEAESIAQAHDGPLHLLLTDVVLPSRNGRKVAETVQAKFPGLPVVYMSGYTEDAIVRHGVLEEGIALLTKPFTREELLDRVAASLAGR